MEVDARFARRRHRRAHWQLIHNLWDQMTDESGPYYTGALWEKLNQDGTDVDANASLAHGWATGPVSSLSGYVLGARPVTAGYKTWVIAPQPGDAASGRRARSRRRPARSSRAGAAATATRRSR